jgi:hypothetical protein
MMTRGRDKVIFNSALLELNPIIAKWNKSNNWKKATKRGTVRRLEFIDPSFRVSG